MPKRFQIVNKSYLLLFYGQRIMTRSNRIIERRASRQNIAVTLDFFLIFVKHEQQNFHQFSALTPLVCTTAQLTSELFCDCMDSNFACT